MAFVPWVAAGALPLCHIVSKEQVDFLFSKCLLKLSIQNFSAGSKNLALCLSPQIVGAL